MSPQILAIPSPLYSGELYSFVFISSFIALTSSGPFDSLAYLSTLFAILINCLEAFGNNSGTYSASVITPTASPL